MDRFLTQCVIFVLCLACLPGTGSSLAAVSREDLVRRIVLSLNEELASDIGGLAILRLENAVDDSLDIDLLRRELELTLIRESRFVLAGRRQLDAALRDAGLCDRLSCFAELETLRQFGSDTGIDAFLIGEIIASSMQLNNLDGRDYFITLRMRAVGTRMATTLWQREITGINVQDVVDVLGAMPDLVATSRETAFGNAFAEFIGSSEKVAARGIRTVALLGFESGENDEIEGDLLRSRMAGALALGTRVLSVDGEYLRTHLRGQGLGPDALAGRSIQRDLGREFGIDAFVGGRVVSVDDDRVECMLRVTVAGTITDLDAGLIVGQGQNERWALPELLSRVGQMSIETPSPEMTVAMNGRLLGHTENLLVELTPKTRGQVLLRSLLLPGLGQRYAERRTRGWIFSLAAVGAASFALLNQNSYESAVDDYDAASDTYRAAYSQAQMDAAFAVMEEKFASAEDTKSRRDFALLALGCVWLANVVDAAFGSPLGDAHVSVGAVTTPDGRTALAATIGIPRR